MPRIYYEDDYEDYDYDDIEPEIPPGYEQCGSCGRIMKPMVENGECPHCWGMYH